jgi:hypothetical protein
LDNADIDADDGFPAISLGLSLELIGVAATVAEGEIYEAIKGRSRHFDAVRGNRASR